MPETIGQRLKLARQDRRLTIEKAAEATRIRPHYLQALEADDYSVMPSAPQARGFLRNYADFLDLDLGSILAELQAAHAPVDQVIGPLPQVDLAPAAPEASEKAPVAEEPAKAPFWSLWLARLRKPESTPGPEPAQPPAPEVEELPAALPAVQEPLTLPVVVEESKTIPVVVEEASAIIEQASKPRVRKKKAETVPAVEAQPAVQEPPTRKRRTKKAEEVPAVQEPPTRLRRKKKVEAEEPVVEPLQSEAEILPVVEPQAEVQEIAQVDIPTPAAAARPSLPARIESFFKSLPIFRASKKKNHEAAPVEADVPQIETESEPEASFAQYSKIETAASQPTETPEAIHAEIGGQLRKRRELLSLTFEEIERHTHVRAVFAKALEDGDFDQLPSAVQTRGMLTAYATFLDLDTDALLLRFADALQAGHRARYPERTSGERAPKTVRSTLPTLRSFMAGDLLFGVGIVVMLVALAAWGLGRVFAQQTEQVSLPTAPSISDVLAGTPLPTLAQEVTLIAVADTPFALAGTGTPEGGTPVAPTQNFNVNVALNIIATERAYMRVLVDGEEVFNGRVVPGTAYPFEAAESIQVLTGNGAALRVTYNGRDLGLLGNFGQVVDYIYFASSIVTPTPLAPPTATHTPNVSPTPSPTLSPTPTPTQTVTPSG
jgi:cytoskeletal protein RodZ